MAGTASLCLSFLLLAMVVIPGETAYAVEDIKTFFTDCVFGWKFGGSFPSILVKGVGRLDHDAGNRLDNKQILAHWIARYSDILLRTCYVYLQDLAQAEDALQDTFLKAYQSMSRCSVESERAWLVRIAINTCHDYYRSRWFRYIDKTRSVEALLQHTPEILPEDHDLLAEVYHLPEKSKQVLLLYYYQEMTLQETAYVLGISRSAVHKRLQKAQRLLKGKLTGRDIDDE